MGWIGHRFPTMAWRRALPLGLALGLSLPAVALMRIGSLVPFDIEWALTLAPVPDGDWAGGWGSGARTATAVRTGAFEATLQLVVGLSLVLWSSALMLGVLAALRRVAAERPEWALRSALGATRRQMRSELRREGLAGSALAVTLGLPLAIVTLELVTRLRPGGVVVTDEAGASLLLGAPAAGLLGATVLAVTLLPMLLFPAARVLRRPESAGATTLRGDLIWLLAAAQVAGCLAIAATVTLLAGASPVPDVASRQYPHARDTLVLRARLPGEADPARSWPQIRQAVERLSGVEAASVTSPGAVLGFGTVDRNGALCSTCRAAGLGKPVTFATARHLAVDDGFFELLGVDARLPSGSWEVALGPRLARRLFQSEEPVGQRVWMQGASPLSGRYATVDLVVPDATPSPAGPWLAGLAGDAPNGSPDVVLVSLASAAPRAADIVIRGSGPPVDQLRAEAVSAVAGVMPGAAVEVVGRLDRLLAQEAEPLRWSAAASAGLGSGAFLFAMLGLAGAMAERVRSRRAEIGLRRAVGATRSHVVRIVMADASRLAVAGVLLGTALGGSMSRALTGMLAGVRPLTAAELATLSALAVLTALGASAGAAVRAARMDPVAALGG